MQQYILSVKPVGQTVLTVKKDDHQDSKQSGDIRSQLTEQGFKNLDFHIDYAGNYILQIPATHEFNDFVAMKIKPVKEQKSNGFEMKTMPTKSMGAF